MHDLERRALDDPFLMHALEGYEIAGANQQAATEELSVRLQQRIAKKERRIIPWQMMGIAASILIVLSAGVLWLTGTRNVYKAEPAVKTVVAVPLSPVVAQAPANKPGAVATEDNTIVTDPKKQPPVTAAVVPIEPAGKPKIAELKSVAAASILAVNPNIKDSVAKDTTPLNEMVVMGYAQKKKEVTNAITVINLGKLKKVKDTVPEQLLQGQAAGVANNNTLPEHPATTYTVEGQTIPVKSLREISIINKSYAASINVIKGRVVASNDGSPVPGATVKVAGTNIGAITDVNGRFALPADSSKSKLVVSNAAGYLAPITTSDSTTEYKNVPPPSSDELSEVVVVRKANIVPAPLKAHPQPGWDKFRDYLNRNAVSPEGKTGKVHLSFTVDKNGLITGIKIEKGLGRAINKKAIGLINNGPAWLGNTNGQPETIKLTIKFSK